MQSNSNRFLDWTDCFIFKINAISFSLSSSIADYDVTTHGPQIVIYYNIQYLLSGRWTHRAASCYRITTINLTVAKVDAENGLLLIKGAVPGPIGSLILVRSAAKNQVKAGKK